MTWESVKIVKKSKTDYEASGHCIIRIKKMRIKKEI